MSAGMVHFNFGGGNHLRRDPIYGCPVCGIEDAPVVRSTPGSPYYGASGTCTCCGDSWADGELRERPFARGWRQRSIARAVAMWEEACECAIVRDDDLYVLPCAHEDPAAVSHE